MIKLRHQVTEHQLHQFLGDLRQMLSRDTGIDVSQLLLTEIDGLTFKKTFRDSQQVSCLKPPAKSPAVDKSKKGAATKAAASPAAATESSSESSLYCIEMPRHREDSEDDGAFIVLTWVNVLKEGPIEKRSVRLERESTKCQAFLDAALPEKNTQLKKIKLWKKL